jgi:hypothetical protein
MKTRTGFLQRRLRQDGERGVTMVIVALALPALVGFAGLAIDGSRAYDERRQMQNAADAAALAGTRVFNNWLMNPEMDPTNPQPYETSPAQVNKEVLAVAIENGADPAQVRCNWIAKGDPTKPGAELGPCSTTSQIGLASGVRVRTGSTRDTYFIRSSGSAKFTAAAVATAQVQRLLRFTQDIPFLICSQYEQVDGLEDEAADLLDQDAAGVWSIKPEAFGKTIKIHGPKQNDCGLQGSNFKGVADTTGVNEGASIPGWWAPDPGVRAGQVRQDLGGMGGCDADGNLDGCVLLLPICPNSNGGNVNNNGGGDGRMNCTQLGLFEIHGDGNTHTGTLLQETVTLNDGEGGDMPLGQNEARLVRLVS